MRIQNSTVCQELLADLTGYNKPAEIAASLARNGVPFFRGKRGKVWTTVAAINSALGVSLKKHISDLDESDLIEVL